MKPPSAIITLAIAGLAALTMTGTSAASPPAAHAAARPVNLVVNGSFERPAVAMPCPEGGGLPGFCPFRKGSTLIPGWSIGVHSVDLVSTYFQPARGHQSVDLSGDAPGSLTQKVRTTPGTTYNLSWYMADNPVCGQKVKTMNVYWNRTLIAAPTFSTATTSVTTMGWTYEQVSVTASTSRSIITFADATPDHSLCGPTLDSVSLTPR